MSGEIEEKAAEALEAETDKAEAETAAASSVAAATAVAAAESAVALAKGESAVAMQRAAETISETEENLSWLKTQQAELSNSLLSLSKKQEAQELATNAIAENQAKILEALQQLTPPKLTEKTEAEIVKPSEAEEDRKEAEAEKLAAQSKPRRMFF